MVINGTDYVIKNVDKNECENIFNVYKQCEDFLSLGPQAKATMQMVMDDLKHSAEEGGIFYGIYIKDEMAGVIDYIPNNFNSKPDTAFISLLMISKSYRGRGLGSSVVKTIENEILKDKNIKTIESGVQINNKEGLLFWGRMGYKIISGPNYFPDKTIAYGLQKRIF